MLILRAFFPPPLIKCRSIRFSDKRQLWLRDSKVQIVEMDMDRVCKIIEG